MAGERFLVVNMAAAGQKGNTKVQPQNSIWQNVGGLSLLKFTILTLAWLLGFSTRLFAVIRFESIIHEFDPW